MAAAQSVRLSSRNSLTVRFRTPHQERLGRSSGESGEPRSVSSISVRYHARRRSMRQARDKGGRYQQQDARNQQQGDDELDLGRGAGGALADAAGALGAGPGRLGVARVGGGGGGAGGG